MSNSSDILKTKVKQTHTATHTDAVTPNDSYHHNKREIYGTTQLLFQNNQLFKQTKTKRKRNKRKEIQKKKIIMIRK